MKLVKTFLLSFSILSFIPSIFAQKVNTNNASLESIQEHYKYLKQENESYRKFLEKENESFRKFLEEERKTHRAFLENSYQEMKNTIMVIVGVFVAILTFLGWKTLASIKEKTESLTKKTVDNEVARFEKNLKTQMDEYISLTQVRFDTLQRMIKQEVSWNDSKIRFTGTEAALKSLENYELTFFGGNKENFTIGHSNKNEILNQFDVIVHCYDATSKIDVKKKDQKGNEITVKEDWDEVLGNLITSLSNANIPLVIYTKDAWLGGKMRSTIQSYPFSTMANNVITLLRNTADAHKLGIK